MTGPKSQAEILRARALQLRREAIELQSSPQPRFVKWVLGKYLAFASRGIEEAQRLEERERQERQDRIEVDRVRAALRAQALGASAPGPVPGPGPSGDDPSRR